MLTLQGVTYKHPNGDCLFSELDLTINRHDKIALIGNNGTGKSTLLNIIAGRILPTAGVINGTFHSYYVPQVVGQFNHFTVAEALGVEKLKALREILTGDVSESNLETIGNDWTIEERCRTAFAHWQLSDVALDQKMETLSGGQKTKVFLSGIMIYEPEFVLLDEPSNHLDSGSREMLYDYLRSCRDTVLVVSHDRALLNLMSKIAVLGANGIRTYGGNYAFYEEQNEMEINALREELKSKEKTLRKAKQLERETLERKQKLDARGKKKQEKAGIPTIMLNTLRNNAEKSAARLKDVHTEKIEGIALELKDLRNEIPALDAIKLDLDDSKLHRKKVLVSAKEINFSFDGNRLWDKDLSVEIRSGERICITGPNGSGKTTLIKLLIGNLPPSSGSLDLAKCRIIYIDQDYSLVNKHLSIYDQAQEFNLESISEHEIKIRLNRFLFTKDEWDKPTRVLSGGEKMKLILCLLMISTKAPDLIILDEPTNNLDLGSLKILTAAINQYRGTLIVVSHDKRFLEEIGVGRFIQL